MLKTSMWVKMSIKDLQSCMINKAVYIKYNKYIFIQTATQATHIFMYDAGSVEHESSLSSCQITAAGIRWSACWIVADRWLDNSGGH